MKFKQDIPKPPASKRRGGFTLIEALVAVLFMAIVIPVALDGLHVAALAGETGLRKVVAMRIANKVLNDLRVENLLQAGSQRGVVRENGVSYTWNQNTAMWNGDPLARMSVATVTVNFGVQGRPCNVRLSTLVPPAASTIP